MIHIRMSLWKKNTVYFDQVNSFHSNFQFTFQYKKNQKIFLDLLFLVTVITKKKLEFIKRKQISTFKIENWSATKSSEAT